MSADEIGELKPEIPDWQLLERDGVARLERVFLFPSFADALAFTNRVGALAEEEGVPSTYSPDWLTPLAGGIRDGAHPRGAPPPP